MLKKLLKKILPARIIIAYHFCLAWCAALWYGFPARRMMIIGVTGTKGKTSTANFIWAVLEAGGKKTGIITTANIRIGDKEIPNKYHMTMPGRFVIQRFLARMVRAGCTHCVVETTSEGLKQYRHAGIRYNTAVFTNLTPEHLPSHGGSFEKYKETKGKMFAMKPDVIIANADSEHAGYFLNFNAGRKITYAVDHAADYVAANIKEVPGGVDFNCAPNCATLNVAQFGAQYHLGILGKFNVYNALPAIIIGRLLGIGDDNIARGLKELAVIPGRMELVDEGQDFIVIVDYAHEKQSVTNVLKTANAMSDTKERYLTSGGKKSKVIILLGAEGGGRDKSKRPAMGEVAGKEADYMIISNTDPYDDDPLEIAEDIAMAAEAAGKIRNQNLFIIEDRRLGIRKALGLARAGDIVIICGKGAEQSMLIGGKSIPWDDRVIVSEELKRI